MSKALRTGITSSSASLATPGNDTITVTADSLIGATLDGGAGTDTLQLNGGGAFDLYRVSQFDSIEILKGSTEDDIIEIWDGFGSANPLESLQTIDGGGGEDTLVLYCYDLDLRDKTITGFKEIRLEDPWGSTVTLNDKALALQITGYWGYEDHIVLEGDIALTDDEIKALFDQGIEMITDKNGDHYAARPDVMGLDGDIHMIAGRDMGVMLDVGGDAVVSDDDDAVLSYLWVSHDELTSTEAVRIRESEDVILSEGMTAGSTITLKEGADLIVIGTINDMSGNGFSVTFNGNATHARVQELLHALEYRNASGDTSSTLVRNISISVADKGERYSLSNISIAITPDGYKVLTSGEDNLTGTADGDVFVALSNTFNIGDKIVGGDGTVIDTLQALNGLPYGTTFDLTGLATFSGIEAVRMTDSHNDVIKTNAERMAGVRIFDGGGGDEDKLQLVGTALDLRGKLIENMEVVELVDRDASIIVDSKEVASIILADFYGDASLELSGGGTFSKEELKALFERNIKTVKDANGTHTNNAPVINGLNGDRLKVTPGGTVFVDADRNATVSDDYDGFGMVEIGVSAAAGGGGTANDLLGIDTNGAVKLSKGLVYGSNVLIGDKEIGSIGSVFSDFIQVHFNANVTATQVQQVLAAFTYKNTRPAGTPLGGIEISILLWDTGGKTTKSTITVEEGSAAPGNTAPSNLGLSTSVVKENTATGTVVGSFEVTDPNAGDSFTFTLLDDAGGRFAIRDGQLIVADGAKLDFEQLQSHTVRVRVTDRGRLSYEKDFAVSVTDISETVAGATRGKNVLTGGIGADRLNGGYGNDVLTGGAGADRFVFDARPGTWKTDRKVNFDTITDFTRGEDKILLDNKIFKKLGKGTMEAPGTLNKKFFKKTKATDKNDYLIYKSGVVSYDADGNGAKYKPVEIMKIANKAALSAADFLIV